MSYPARAVGLVNSINCNQHSFVNGKSSLSNILESVDNINQYLMEKDNVNIIRYLIQYLIIV